MKEFSLGILTGSRAGEGEVWESTQVDYKGLRLEDLMPRFTTTGILILLLLLKSFIL